MLCSHIVEILRKQPGSNVLYYFCDYHISSRNSCNDMLRKLATQLIRCDTDFSLHVWDSCVRNGLSSSIEHLRKLLGELISASSLVRIVLDGLDECEEQEHKPVLDCLAILCAESKGKCTVLIASRDGGFIARKLRQKPTISLQEERQAVHHDIEAFVCGKLSEVIKEFHPEVGPQLEKQIQEELIHRSSGMISLYMDGIIAKSSPGMFLWVELVLGTLQYQFTEEDLLTTIRKILETLEGV